VVKIMPTRMGERLRGRSGVLRPKLLYALLVGQLLALSLAAGCVSRKKADSQARAAFMSGRQQAAMMARQMQLQGPVVTVVGEVHNPQVRWTSDLTLAKALIAADYYGKANPTEIIIIRGGKQLPYDPSKLLSGEDVPLEPNDLIQVR
jgi:hypothetical protein